MPPAARQNLPDGRFQGGALGLLPQIRRAVLRGDPGVYPAERPPQARRELQAEPFGPPGPSPGLPSVPVRPGSVRRQEPRRRRGAQDPPVGRGLRQGGPRQRSARVQNGVASNRGFLRRPEDDAAPLCCQDNLWPTPPSRSP